MPRDRGACVEVESGCVTPIDDATNTYVGTSNICPTSTGERTRILALICTQLWFPTPFLVVDYD